MTDAATRAKLLELAERSRMRALEELLEGLPPYPRGTVVREMQDELAALRAIASEKNDGQ